MTKTQRDNLVLKHMENVGRIAKDIARKLPVNVDVDDLTQAGMVGLVDASKRYDPATGLKFWTFASHRVRGEILDYLRAIDGAPRSTRTVQKKADAFIGEHLRRFGSPPSDTLVAEALKMPIERWLKWKIRLLHSSEISMEPKKVSPDDELPREFTDRKPLQDFEASRGQISGHVLGALEKLEEKERKVLIEYFFSQKTLVQTGDSLGVAESRVSQMKKAALIRMKELLDAAGIRRGTI